MSESPETMSRVDTAWLRMDRPHNLMMIVGVWLLRPAIDAAALRERLQTKLLRFARFRCKVVHEAFQSSWVDDAEFDMNRHVIREKLPRKRGQSEREALQARAAELAATKLDPAHPLWQVHLIDHFEDGSALIIRIHHCIADGIALNAVLMSIADGGAELIPHAQDQRHGAADTGWIAQTLIEPFTDFTVKGIGLAGDGVARVIRTLAQPQQRLDDSIEWSAEMGRAGVQVARDIAALALMPNDSPTLLKGALSGKKAVAWCEPLPLEQVKAIGKALNASVNDVLLACVAGSIGHYLRARGDNPAGKEIRAMVPVNLRPLQDAWQLGNCFGLAPVVLPIGVDNPVERLYAVRSRMAELKGSTQPLLAYELLALSGLLSKPMQDALSDVFLQKTTAVITNVPGPSAPLEFCGSRLRQAIFWVPSSGDVGIGVSIVSYAGGVQFGLIADRARCPDPQRIVEQFAPEFESLLLLALMLPWAVEAGRLAGKGAPTPSEVAGSAAVSKSRANSASEPASAAAFEPDFEPALALAR
jgi:diacylglycerol O-acyltransferase / wax synthase